VNLQTGAEFGDMTKILRNLGSCPPCFEFGAICEFSSRGNDAIYELFRLIFPHDVFRLYALDFEIENEPPLTAGKFLSLMEGHVIAKAAYMGTYR